MNTIIEKELIYINGGMTSIAGGGVSRENSAENSRGCGRSRKCAG